MERSRDHGDLAATLAEIRPAPRAAFTEGLDRRVAEGFPRSTRMAGSPLAGVANWFARLTPERLLLAGGTAALAAIAIATVIVAGSDTGSRRIALDSPLPARHRSGEFSEVIPRRTAPESSNAGTGVLSSAEEHSSVRAHSGAQPMNFNDSSPASLGAGSASADTRHREIERSAEISLLAAPADVAADSADVFAAVHDADGIVLHSTTSSGKSAGARFDLLIPSARLGDALAAFSAIDEVRSRHEATDDITAPTVSAREELQDSRARIDTLLAQLAGAETESEALTIEAELRTERRHAARLRARLANLGQRTTYSRVSVRIESGTSASSGGAWGFDDAIGDAGRILGVAAAITLVGLAIVAPIALIALLAWLAHRAWLRRARQRALGRV
jgi:Domain of unknown function (DUF4349)